VGEEQIKAAYRRLALQLHPDRHVNAEPAARAAAAAQFARLLAAYDTLRDPEQRRLYDAGHLVEASLNL
jgi:curved DNA-binding protein CbpA